MTPTPNSVKTAKEVANGLVAASVHKVHTRLPHLLILGIFAGMFIGFGAACSMVAIHGIANAGLAKLIAGIIFPVGLMLIVLVGGELFTGNCLMALGALHGRYSLFAMMKTLAIVFASNLIGALLIVFFVTHSGQQNMSAGLLGGYTIQVAYTKSTLSFSAAFVSGIACNIMVCAAVLMAQAATDVVGKIAAIFFPIMVFIVGGFEQCVANMYYIPAGLVALRNEHYTLAAIEHYGLSLLELEALTIQNFLLNNLLPVTLGNMVGGMVFVALPLYLLHGLPEKHEDETHEIDFFAHDIA